jgi:hypothetical protein
LFTGTWTLIRALQKNKIKVKYFMMTSSLLSLVGMQGTIDYCAANMYLDVVSECCNTPNVQQFMAINWPAWRDAGMMATYANKKSVNSLQQLLDTNTISEREGIDIFAKCIKSQYSGQIIVCVQHPKELQMGTRQFQQGEAMSTGDNDTETFTNQPPNSVSDIETILLRIWNEVLMSENTTVGDNFFEIGGNSLSAVQVMTKVRKYLGLKLPVKLLFENQTITEFANELMELYTEKMLHEASNEINNH